MESLMRALLERRWQVGTGKDASVARRGLKLMKSSELRSVREPDALDILVINERSRMHYWLGHLWSEFSRQLGRDLPTGTDGTIRWLTGNEAIWGFMDWKGERYVFALDKASVLERMSAQLEQGTLPGSRVIGQILEPTDREPAGLLTRRSLGPWLSDWTLVFLPRDAAALADTGERRFQNNLTIVLLTLVLISLGVFLSAKQIKRELDMARMQTDFAANVSHELRSPITQIRLKGEMLMLGMFDEDAEREDAYQAIVRESERLSRLVDNVLDFGAIERGLKQYDLRPADLADTVHRAIDIVSSSQEVQDKVLDLDLPEVLPPVQHDPDAIAQCVINLVSNAAKYSEQGGWIGVRSRILEAAVEINISDKGIGIPAADLKNIFEPFYRSSDKTARLRKGTGIGLTITRYIMQAHGGEVSVQSRPGIGSTFTLRFPCQPGDIDPLYS
jgi:two-component system phosphate regulon sensor histidine kinase PhoR